MPDFIGLVAVLVMPLRGGAFLNLAEMKYGISACCVLSWCEALRLLFSVGGSLGIFRHLP
jgi:hypothetical protein